MAQFNGMVVTNKGRELLARALASKGKFIITAAALGDGAYSGNFRECEELVNKKLDLILMGAYSEKGSTKITVGITNKNVSESFRTNEIGVYAKLEGDTKAILYAYDVAVEADTVPNNALGTTLELVYDIYFDVSSEVEVILEITDSIAFLTQDIAKRDFIKTDIISGGNLKDKTQLEADKQYYADDGKWYQNIGGDRPWTTGNGVPDSLFKELSWKEINKDLNGKLDTGTYEGKASDLKKDIDNLSNGKYDKTGGKLSGTVILDTPSGSNSSRVEFQTAGVNKGYVGRIENVTKGYIGVHNYATDKYMRLFDDGTAEIGADNLITPTKEVIGGMNEELRFIANNSGRKIGELYYIQNSGTKIIGQYYFDKNTYGLYKCLNTTTSVNNDSNFIDDSNFTIALLARDNQSKIVNLNKTDYLYSGSFSGAGTFAITNILKYNLIQLTIVISTSDTITTHAQYSVCFTPTTKFDWGDNQHTLGAIAISVTAGTLYISGAGAQYVKIKEIYGIGKKEA